MTQILVVGDSLVGKTNFMYHVTTGTVPINVFRSVSPEYFRPLRDANFIVAPGQIMDTQLQRLADGVDGIMVLYNEGSTIMSAKRWLLRLRRLMVGVEKAPILVCCHGDVGASENLNGRLDLLRAYPLAEHTYTSVSRRVGMIDCINRITCRARREHPSPLAVRAI